MSVHAHLSQSTSSEALRYLRLTRVLHDHIALLVLVVSQRQQNDIALVDPDLLPELATDMRETTCAVEALRLQTSVAEHLDDLRVFLALLLEDELALLVVVLVLSTSPVLTTLRCVSAGFYGVIGVGGGSVRGARSADSATLRRRWKAWWTGFWASSQHVRASPHRAPLPANNKHEKHSTYLSLVLRHIGDCSCVCSK